MQGVADCHSHILPGMDDGSRNVEESIVLLRLLAEQGIPHAAATPHFDPCCDTPARFLARRAAAETALREEMQRHSGLPRVSIGAEVYFSPGISDWEELAELSYGGADYVLIEMPPFPWNASHYRELEAIAEKQGLTPVIAHIDRYLGRFPARQFTRQLTELPVLVQANASFFLNPFTAPAALGLLRKGNIHLLGSDCHNLHTRPPNLGPAVRKIRSSLGDGAIARIQFYQKEVLKEP